MTKTTIWTLILSLALTSAAFAATDEENCQKGKLINLGKRSLCIEKERGKEVTGKVPDFAKCDEKFDIGVAKADAKAAKKGASCRWLVNGDGTATDLNSELQWELKTDDGSIHDKDNIYNWGPTGTAFVTFLGTLNGGGSSDGVATTGCFVDKCDWRFPTIEELAGIVDLSAPGCGGGSPCTTIPGETDPSFYWSSSANSNFANTSWIVYFFNGVVTYDSNTNNFHHVRAVRGGS